jgi:outer membrane biosynthesis protein TonB
MKKIAQILLAIFISAFLIVSLQLMNILIKGDFLKKKEVKTTSISLTKPEPPKPKLQEQKKEAKRPQRVTSQDRSPKVGPRFAMDLSVAGLGGASAPMNLVNKRGGGGGADGSSNGDVDNRPSINGSPSIELPNKIRESEINATVVLSFCVNPSGQAERISIIEETPAGMGLGEAGKRAIMNSRFSPATKDGKAVMFCGMEQPFEVRFND